MKCFEVKQSFFSRLLKEIFLTDVFNRLMPRPLYLNLKTTNELERATRGIRLRAFLSLDKQSERIELRCITPNEVKAK